MIPPSDSSQCWYQLIVFSRVMSLVLHVVFESGIFAESHCVDLVCTSWPILLGYGSNDYLLIFFFYSICGGIFVYLIFLLAPGLPVSSWWCWNKHKKLPQSGPPGAYKRGEELWPVERQHDSWAGFCLWWDSVCHCHPLCICIVVRMSNVPPPLNLQYCIAFIYICSCWRLCFHGVFFSLVIIQCTVWELLILYLPVSCRELRCTNRNYFLDLWGLLPFFLFVFVSIHSFWHSFLILLGFTWQPVIFVWNSPQ